jgi:hypothetical protein
MKFEYKIGRWEDQVDLTLSDEVLHRRLIDRLNSFGVEGWELVHFQPFYTPDKEFLYTIWKRACSV